MEMPLVPLGSAVRHRKEFIDVIDTHSYKRCRVRLHAEGIVLRDWVEGIELKTKRQQVCRAGELLVAEIDAKHGGFGIVPEDLDGAIVSSHYFLYEIDEERLDRHFLGYFIRTNAFREQVAAQGTTNYAAIRPHHVLDYLVPLPPLPEQRRIVARIDVLAEKIEEARRLRAIVGEETSILWPSILQSAIGSAERVTGNNGTSAESALRAQAARYGEGGRSQFNNAHPWNPSIHEKGPFELGQGWIWTDLGSALTHIVECVNDTPDFSERNTGFIGAKSTNIRPYRFDKSLLWFVTEEDFLHWNRRLAPQSGDIILTREAPVGNACLIPDGLKVCLTQRMVLLRANPEYVHPAFVLHFLKSDLFMDQVKDASRGLTTPHIRVRDIPRFILPLPPPATQKEIVEILDQLLLRMSLISNAQDAAEQELDSLLSAILDEAFRGDL